MTRKRKIEPGEIQGIELRSSSAEFLAFTAASGESGVEALFKDEMIWATQRMMAELYDCSVDNISLHLKNLYADGELNEAQSSFSPCGHVGNRWRKLRSAVPAAGPFQRGWRRSRPRAATLES